MPYKADEARRNRILQARYQVTNWPEYDGALQRRGGLTVWVAPEALAAWPIASAPVLSARRRATAAPNASSAP